MGNMTSRSRGREMEEMREVSMIYYAKMSNDQMQLVQSFFNSIDANRDGKISAVEFSDFVRENCSQHVPPNLFKLLDRNKDGSLDLEEFVPFYYMRKVCVPVICDGCRSFLWGPYFLCVECYDVCNRTFNLCRSCYRNNNFTHDHSTFLDNHALLLRTKQYERKREMGGICKAAETHFAALSDSEKQELQNRFNNIDSDRDSMVSRREYSNYITESRYSSDLFDVADKDKDGMLSFKEFLTLHFIHNQRGYWLCGGCSDPMMGIYLVCVKCHDAGRTYDICFKCYGDKNYTHEDDHTYFTDIHSLIRKSKPRAIMEELINTARVYYDKSSLEVRKAAKEFFEELDHDNDEKVSLKEFLGIMWKLGHLKLGSKAIFKELDQDGNGHLEFDEVMAVYYIIKSGRPFCGGCDEFLTGIYFTCSVCFDNGNDLFCICQNCFQADNYSHDQAHHHAQFLDNYALLEAKRIKQQKASSSVTELQTSTTNDVEVGIYYPRQQWVRRHASSAVGVVVKTGELLTAAEVAFKALEYAVDAMKTKCTIM